MAVDRISAHWRDSGRVPRFFIIDARSAFPLLLFLMHIKLWTFVVAIITMAFFGSIEHFGFTTIVFLRLLRTYLAGRRKPTQPWWREERVR
jgi:intracellular multiplication protein IcmT